MKIKDLGFKSLDFNLLRNTLYESTGLAPATPQAGDNEIDQGETTMRKFVLLAGMLFVAFLFAPASKADSIDNFQLTGPGFNVTFSLPSTLTPSSVLPSGMINISNVSGTFNGGSYTFDTVQLGPSGYMNATDYLAYGSQTKSIEFVAPGLFSFNSDGTVTLNTGTFSLDQGLYTLVVTDPPSVNTPEPASLLLLGLGGLGLGALVRRKRA